MRFLERYRVISNKAKTWWVQLQIVYRSPRNHGSTLTGTKLKRTGSYNVGPLLSSSFFLSFFFLFVCCFTYTSMYSIEVAIVTHHVLHPTPSMQPLVRVHSTSHRRCIFDVTCCLQYREQRGLNDRRDVARTRTVNYFTSTSSFINFPNEKQHDPFRTRASFFVISTRY